MSSAVRLVNVASSHLVEENLAGALAAIGSMDGNIEGAEDHAWLWDPRTLTSAPRVIFIAPSQWAALAKDQVRS